MGRWLNHLVLIIFITVSIFGCGYHFAGSGSLPAGVSQVFITVMENKSAETGAERIFTNDLIDEFTRRRKDSLAETRDAADGIISGTIIALNVDNIARSTVSEATERQVTGRIKLALSSPDGKLLWSSGTIVERQAYAVSEVDSETTERNKALAIAAVSKKIAESAFNRLTDDF